MVYDVIIVGGGPAGLTAGVYARTRKLSTLILEAQATGGQLEWLYPTKSVYDYPSYIAIEGGELAQLFVLHSRESGAEIRPEEVVDVQRQASGFKLATRQGSAYEGRSIILAMGMGLLEPKRLGVPGEAEFESNGVEYRVRDRREFKGKRVVAVGRRARRGPADPGQGGHVHLGPRHLRVRRHGVVPRERQADRDGLRGGGDRRHVRVQVSQAAVLGLSARRSAGSASGVSIK